MIIVLFVSPGYPFIRSHLKIEGIAIGVNLHHSSPHLCDGTRLLKPNPVFFTRTGNSTRKSEVQAYSSIYAFYDSPMVKNNFYLMHHNEHREHLAARVLETFPFILDGGLSLSVEPDILYRILEYCAWFLLL
jgi:hypothetical protein